MSGNRFSLAGALAVTAALAVLLPLAPPAVAATHHKRDSQDGHDKHKAADDKPAKPSPGGVRLLGKSGDWSAYASSASSGKVCYLAGEPSKSEPAKFARKQPMAMVTHRPAENISNVVSFVEGYPLKPGSQVELMVGKRKFELFTKDDSAWASTSGLDREIVGALDRAYSVTVRGEPLHGPRTADVYSLAGFSQALGMIDKACGIKRDDRETRPAAHPASHHPHHRRSRHESHR
ncbi:MAG TPA: invasion associated locus B family protein [Stellaceae bacterium]|nr:invasion associated locus B family protein [Stellaceae bacterium]